MTDDRLQSGPDSHIRCQKISWEHFDRMARQLAHRIRDSGFNPDLIVAIARGGYLPARILSDHLDIFDLASMKIEHYHGIHKEALVNVRYPLTADVAGRRLLLVDDVSDSGDTFQVAVRHLQERGVPEAVKTAVLHHKRSSDFIPDYYVEEVVAWRWIIYPWAIMEDLTSLLYGMEPRPTSVEAFASRLRRRHQITFPLPILQEVLESAAD